MCAYNCLPADYRRDISRFSPFRPLASRLSPPTPDAALSLAYRASNRDKSGQSVREHRYRLDIYRRLCFAQRSRRVRSPPRAFEHVASSCYRRRPATVAVASSDGPTATNSSYLCTAASSTMMREISRSRVPKMLARRLIVKLSRVIFLKSQSNRYVDYDTLICHVEN